ncbi:creatininase family protein [Ramlibacter sp. PS4R-6]|uniref:creatininase family protein n=1 Tax=Ramlibacter sp. PS4R-6 TaxID=3133438 RepID=UPI00309FA379
MHRRAAFLLFSLWLAAALPAFAQNVHLEEMTWPELRDRMAAGATTVLIPIGGTEQNGPHMVLGKHNVRARVLAGQIARALGNAVVAPVVSYVPDEGHMKYPGTITIGDAAFESLLEGAARSFRRHGFRDIVLLGDHGGYRKDLQQVAAKLNREWKASPVRVHALSEYYRESEHAGLADTSLAMAVDKSLVRGDLLAGAQPDKDGVRGDPRRASAETGQRAMREIVETSVAAIQRLVKR